MTGSRLQQGIHGRDHNRGAADPLLVPWHDLTVESPWSNAGPPYHDAQFGLDPAGLRFRGAISGGSSGDIIGHLPSVFWPEHDEQYVISIGTVPCTLLVSATNGALTPFF